MYHLQAYFNWRSGSPPPLTGDFRPPPGGGTLKPQPFCDPNECHEGVVLLVIHRYSSCLQFSESPSDTVFPANNLAQQI